MSVFREWVYQLWMRDRIRDVRQQHPVHGYRFTDDDSANNQGSPCFYDSQPSGVARDKWLDVDSLQIVWTAPASRSGYLDLGGLLTSATMGYLLPWNATLVEMWLLRDATGALETYRITSDGTDVAQTSFNLTSDTESYNHTMNIDVSQGGILGARLLSGSTIGQTVVHARFRRRI